MIAPITVVADIVHHYYRDGQHVQDPAAESINDDEIVAALEHFFWSGGHVQVRCSVDNTIVSIGALEMRTATCRRGHRWLYVGHSDPGLLPRAGWRQVP